MFNTSINVNSEHVIKKCNLPGPRFPMDPRHPGPQGGPRSPFPPGHAPGGTTEQPRMPAAPTGPGAIPPFQTSKCNIIY